MTGAAPSVEVLIGALLVTVAAWAVGASVPRLGRRWFPLDRPAPAESRLRACVLAVAAVVLPAAALGFAGALHAAGVAATVAALYLAGRYLGSDAAATPTAGRFPRRAPGWPLVLTCALPAFDLIVQLPATAAGWDAMTYHLYFPARWLQEGRLFHVPTVFSDNAAAFAPQNGGLFFAWQMALSGRDALVDVSQVLPLAAAVLALYVICRRLAIAREPATLAALTAVWLAPVRSWTWSANVDVLMIGCWLAAVAWQLRAFEPGRGQGPETGAAGLAGLASGLATGTKTLGLPLVAFAALPWLLLAAWRRRYLELAAWLAAATAGGGWWYLRNAWLYGNPLFPLDVDLGPLRLAGAYDAAAVRAGEFHLDALSEVAAAVLGGFGPVPCALTAAGLAALAATALPVLRRGSRADRRRAAAAAYLAALGSAWTLFYAVAVPHNNQTRFLLPALFLSLAGWARILQQAAARGRWASRSLWLLTVAAATVTAPPWRSWRTILGTLAEAGVDTEAWLWTAVVVAAVAGLTFRRSAGIGGLRARLLTASGAALVAAALAVATLHADRARGAFLARADFAGWREGYLPFQPPGPFDRGPALRVAYTGTNVPYALMGVGWRHRATYVNTQGRAGDGFYDFWRRDPRTYPYHKPGLYRSRDDEALWLDHLEAARIDVLAIFRLHWAEQRYLWSTPEGFPIEELWARRRPDRFAPIVDAPNARIYSVLSAGSRPPDRSPGSSP